MKRIALATILVAAGLAAAVIVYRAWAPLGKLQDGALPQMVEMEALAKGRMAQFEVSDTPTALPPLTMEAPDGRTIGMDHFGGKVVLLNFWATWCAPCLREMPSLDRLQKELGGETFTVVALSQDRGGRDVAGRFLEKLGLRDLAPYADPTGAAAVALGVTGLPTTVLIDVHGREIGRLTGAAEWDSPEAKALIRAAIGDGEGSASQS